MEDECDGENFFNGNLSNNFFSPINLDFKRNESNVNENFTSLSDYAASYLRSKGKPERKFPLQSHDSFNPLAISTCSSEELDENKGDRDSKCFPEYISNRDNKGENFDTETNNVSDKISELVIEDSITENESIILDQLSDDINDCDDTICSNNVDWRTRLMDRFPIYLCRKRKLLNSYTDQECILDLTEIVSDILLFQPVSAFQMVFCRKWKSLPEPVVVRKDKYTPTEIKKFKFDEPSPDDLLKLKF